MKECKIRDGAVFLNRKRKDFFKGNVENNQNNAGTLDIQLLNFFLILSGISAPLTKM